MRILLLKYNKPINESLEVLSTHLQEHDIIWGNLAEFGNHSDLLSYHAINRYLTSFGSFDVIIIGDVFWTTGQNICQWCSKRKSIKCIFLQHGQWIYTESKKKLRYYPTHTALFGTAVADECKSWPYGKFSKIYAAGSPRYDIYEPNYGGDYIFFSPPVMQELIHGKPRPMREPFWYCLQCISGFEKETKVVMQPHYREHRVDILQELFPVCEMVSSSANTIDLVSKAKKVVASRNSTVVLDAIVCGKPTVFTEMPQYDVSYFKRGFFKSFGLENDNKTEFINNVLAEYGLNMTGYKYAALPYIRLGDASKRIKDLIER